jgi:hypothetical protein
MEDYPDFLKMDYNEWSGIGHRYAAEKKAP